MKKKVLVVGAGITGATIARILADTEKFQIEVLEEKSNIGGACSDTFEQFAYYQNHGAHIFNTNNKDIWSFVSRFTKWHPFHHKVLGLVSGSLVPIPININSLERIFSKEYVDLFLENLCYNKEYTFEDLENAAKTSEILKVLLDWIYNNVFKNYSLKQWEKIPDRSILNRVKVFRCSRDDRYFLTDFQGIPEKGYTEMIKNMLDNENISIKLNSKFTLDTINVSQYSYIFYCGAIDELLNYEYGPLEYRTCKFDRFLYKGRYRQQAAVINYPNSYDFTRCHDYSYFMPEYENGYFVKEYPVKYELNKGLERYYPINDDINNALYNKYVESLKQRYSNIIPIGRLGSFKYFSMDKAIEYTINMLEKEVKELEK